VISAHSGTLLGSGAVRTDRGGGELPGYPLGQSLAGLYLLLLSFIVKGAAVRFLSSIYYITSSDANDR
jgi:hypothetical protein